MSVLLGRLSDRPTTNQYEYYVDDISDLNYLPTRKDGKLIPSVLEKYKSHIPAMGSLCLVINTSQVFCLSSNGWKELCDNNGIIKNKKILSVANNQDVTCVLSNFINTYVGKYKEI